jgi:hypothetical protein
MIASPFWSDKELVKFALKTGPQAIEDLKEILFLYVRQRDCAFQELLEGKVIKKFLDRQFEKLREKGYGLIYFDSWNFEDLDRYLIIKIHIPQKDSNDGKVVALKMRISGIV